jgi:hypothetical protein
MPTKNRNWSYNFEEFRNLGNQPLTSFVKGSNSVLNTFTGVDNPLWRSQVKAGVNATTPASGTMVTVNEPGFLNFFGIIAIKPQYGNTETTYQLIGVPQLQFWRSNEVTVPNSVVTEVTNRAIRKFIDVCDQARSSIEFGQDLGEWKETLHGVLHPLQSLREFTFSHLAKVTKLTRTVKHKASLSKMVADTWLEFKFGWNPLAADVGQGIAALANNKNHVDVQPVRASAKGDFPVFESTDLNHTTLGGGSCHVRTRVTGSYYYTFRGAIKTGANKGSIGLMQNLQLDLPHFVPTIWDLLPYSWIADYFTNIGDVLRSFSFQSSNLTWGNVTARTEYQYDWTYRFVLDNYDPFFYYVKLADDSSVNPSATVVSFQRSVMSQGSLIPTFAITLPLGSWKPWANMAALLLGRQQEITSIAKTLR